jgi:hypothetical protein
MRKTERVSAKNAHRSVSAKNSQVGMCAYCTDNKPILFTLITNKADKTKRTRYFCSFDHLRYDINDAWEDMEKTK